VVVLSLGEGVVTPGLTEERPGELVVPVLPLLAPLPELPPPPEPPPLPPPPPPPCAKAIAPLISSAAAIIEIRFTRAPAGCAASTNGARLAFHGNKRP
jgi:hypothetical protein